MGNTIRRHSARRHTAAALTSTAAVSAAVLATGLLVAPPASASADTLDLTAISAPVWLSGHAVPVTVTAVNPDAALFCGSVRLSLTWWRTGSHHHATSAVVQPTVGAAGTTMTIPATSARAGIVHYRVKGEQTCGLIGEPHPTYTGHSATQTVHVA